jgi:hypothetical protein
MKNLEEIIADYAFSKMQGNGLLLLPLPTGAGKSYTVFKFIHDTVVENACKDKIIFITSLKKNLQPEELKERFNKDELEIFDQKVLYLKSNLDCVLEHLPKLKDDIPNRIQELKEYKSLCQAVEFCVKMEKNTDFNVQDVVKTKKDEIQNTLERQFRRRVKQIFDSEIRNNFAGKVGYKQKLAYLMDKKNKWSWLLTLYPQIMTKERQVYLMSMDKFLLRNDPIIEKSYFIYKELAKDAIIFIDEFDATKSTILDRLTENAVKSRIDYVSAYKQIYDRLVHGDFPAEMTTASEKQKKSGFGQEKLEAIIPSWKKRADEIYDRFHMKYVHKNVEEGEDTAFLFQDIHSMTISGRDDSKEIRIKKADEKRINEISCSQNDDDKESIAFKYMIKDVRGFLKFFCGGVQILATNLVQLKHDYDEDYTYEDAVSSILDNFFPSDSFNRVKQFFIDEILLYHNNKEENRKKEFDGSFFENGFTYFAIEDDNQHSLRSAIMMTSLESTPEKILLEICKNARVFGISATANYETVIGNYAINNYIIPKLKNRYYQLDSGEIKILENHFKKSISHYDRIKINPISIKVDEQYSRNSWAEVFPNDETACDEIYNLVKQSTSSDANDYNRRRYLRIAMVFQKFIQTDCIQSLLCLLTLFPKSKNENLDKDVLMEIFNRIAVGKLSFKENVVILSGGNSYEQKKNEVLTKLGEGKRILVISTYQTIGAGQNLLYDIPEFLKKENENGEMDQIIQINDFDPSGKKDFDAIYLDKPTNLLVQLSNSCEEKEFGKFISQVEYLKEVGEISYDESRRYIKDAFRLKFCGGRKLSIKQSELDSFSFFATKQLVQAVGRICRRNMKRPNVYIFYDSSIAEIIDRRACGANLLNPEFEAFLDSVKTNDTKNDSEKKFEQAAVNRSDEALARIIKYVSDGRNGWKEKAMDEWQQIRAFVLQHPTMSGEEFNACEDLYQPFYIRLPRESNTLWFEREGDYNDIRVSFSYKDGYEQVSSQSARLELFALLPQLKNLIKRIPMDFKQNDYILCPPVFTNIYKGALGEYAGREIFNSLGIELEEIAEPDFFELFDYKIKNTDIYVDFKHWNQHSAFLPRNGQKLQEHIFEKLRRCGGNLALVINIFADKDDVRALLNKEQEGLRIIELPYLFDEESLKMNKEIFQILEEVDK